MNEKDKDDLLERVDLCLGLFDKAHEIKTNNENSLINKLWFFKETRGIIKKIKELDKNFSTAGEQVTELKKIFLDKFQVNNLDEIDNLLEKQEFILLKKRGKGGDHE